MRVSEYDRGVVDGLRRAVSRLHEEAGEMNDPKARDILNTAALSIATLIRDAKAARQGKKD
ncbi:hypothetical protein [Euryhalocaulis caribicus]|uniref:hypothetical protein n=1 Tax=Euryhalocaulis caribicus TaxID=1161401 RepID=UPI0003A99121|nr:hypothetical protein [Euryhalocaulis caribicus]